MEFKKEFAKNLDLMKSKRRKIQPPNKNSKFIRFQEVRQKNPSRYEKIGLIREVAITTDTTIPGLKAAGYAAYEKSPRCFDAILLEQLGGPILSDGHEITISARTLILIAFEERGGAPDRTILVEPDHPSVPFFSPGDFLGWIWGFNA